mmetsp:Transcript_39910/g.98075  ORF Transcript_39910/g.98075 Transcript_39910/m.98075 type:complete len:250 (+) Transcript_39910:894-1643(+)
MPLEERGARVDECCDVGKDKVLRLPRRLDHTHKALHRLANLCVRGEVVHKRSNSYDNARIAAPEEWERRVDDELVVRIKLITLVLVLAAALAAAPRRAALRVAVKGLFLLLLLALFLVVAPLLPVPERLKVWVYKEGPPVSREHPQDHDLPPLVRVRAQTAQLPDVRVKEIPTRWANLLPSRNGRAHNKSRIVLKERLDELHKCVLLCSIESIHLGSRVSSSLTHVGRRVTHTLLHSHDLELSDDRNAD